MPPNEKAPGKNDPKLRDFVVHHVEFGIDLKAKTDQLKVEAHLKYPGAKTRYDSSVDFMLDKLKAK